MALSGSPVPDVVFERQHETSFFTSMMSGTWMPLSTLGMATTPVQGGNRELERSSGRSQLRDASSTFLQSPTQDSAWMQWRMWVLIAAGLGLLAACVGVAASVRTASSDKMAEVPRQSHSSDQQAELAVVLRSHHNDKQVQNISARSNNRIINSSSSSNGSEPETPVEILNESTTSLSEATTTGDSDQALEGDSNITNTSVTMDWPPVADALMGFNDTMLALPENATPTRGLFRGTGTHTTTTTTTTTSTSSRPATATTTPTTTGTSSTSTTTATSTTKLLISGPPRIQALTVDTEMKWKSFEMPGLPGMNYTNVGVGVQWEGFRTKTQLFWDLVHEHAKEAPEEVLILADSGDVAFGGCSEHDLLARYHSVVTASGGAPVVCGADTTIWPERTVRHRTGPVISDSSKYGKFKGRRASVLAAFGLVSTAFDGYMNNSAAPQYVNSGFIMGPAKHLLEALACMKTIHWGADYDDQLALTECMFLRPDLITIDYIGNIVLNLQGFKKSIIRARGSAFRNQVTEGVQCFIHFNAFDADRTEVWLTDWVEEAKQSPQNSPRAAVLPPITQAVAQRPRETQRPRDTEHSETEHEHRPSHRARRPSTTRGAPTQPQHAHSARRQHVLPKECHVGQPVPCCPDSHCGYCAGNQCCWGSEGSTTCPSALAPKGHGCAKVKVYDCTRGNSTEEKNSSDHASSTYSRRDLRKVEGGAEADAHHDAQGDHDSHHRSAGASKVDQEPKSGDEDRLRGKSSPASDARASDELELQEAIEAAAKAEEEERARAHGSSQVKRRNAE